MLADQGSLGEKPLSLDRKRLGYKLAQAVLQEMKRLTVEAYWPQKPCPYLKKTMDCLHKVMSTYVDLLQMYLYLKLAEHPCLPLHSSCLSRVCLYLGQMFSLAVMLQHLAGFCVSR